MTFKKIIANYLRKLANGLDNNRIDGLSVAISNNNTSVNNSHCPECHSDISQWRGYGSGSFSVDGASESIGRCPFCSHILYHFKTDGDPSYQPPRMIG